MIIRKWVFIIKFERINFKGLRNTRDVGQVYTVDGRKVKSNILFRSGRIDKLSNKRIKEFFGKIRFKNLDIHCSCVIFYKNTF